MLMHYLLPMNLVLMLWLLALCAWCMTATRWPDSQIRLQALKRSTMSEADFKELIANQLSYLTKDVSEISARMEAYHRENKARIDQLSANLQDQSEWRSNIRGSITTFTWMIATVLGILAICATWLIKH